MATNAAIPNTMADIKSNNRERFLRLSRQAMLKSQGIFIFLLVSIGGLSIIGFIISHQFAAFYAEDALCFGSQFQVVCN